MKDGKLGAALQELQAFLGERAAAEGIHRMAYSRDWSPRYKDMTDLPDIVVAPNNTDEVAGIVQVALKYNLPVIPFAGGTGIPGIYGCDIDAESIEWCRSNLKGDYRVIPPMPPTDYEDSRFDLVLSASVLTHLTKENQLEWLKEIRRILIPGGLFIATVHGEFAAFFAFGRNAGDALKSGINDDARDGNLNGIAPPDYYRGTFQKKSYTEQVFGKYFNVLEYTEAGSLNFQDLIVMQKPLKRKPFWKLR